MGMCGKSEIRNPKSEITTGTETGTGLRPGNVIPGSSIDFDFLSLLNEKRHPDDRAGLGGGRLVAARGGIALDAGVGFGDLEDDEIGRRDDDGVALPQDHLAEVFFLEPLL